MNADAILAALDLPASCRVDRRVPKTLLLENGAPTGADKRQINESIEELVWVAALKPATIGVAEYRDAIREYLEIAVLRLTLRAGAKVQRLVELVHRAVPYPLLLITELGAQADLSAAHKRWAQNEAGKTVLDGELVVAELSPERDAGPWPAFSAALALGRQPRTALYALYQGWMDTLLALKAARVTGVFVLASDADHAAARQEALRECARLDAEIARLGTAAAREKQMSRRVELNLELKRAEAARAAARERL
ncbi:conserved hypothetical protein [Acidimicrobium ferrooxidans DSM 10331]|uniref:DUF4391 domain-containing protein n=1 Tax=Acidimicrobium ferrooxidans (strain DSM 10331 / JCM 15462 / NBRC 103882 / ICP) TaxID=525909 RepID=C7M011_ACIFD|nr:DUF4391 domain-containing protein [Acidimicrobium ferrooxidans]ACU54319.1 conserved hypothetical protein [Acidimicrobium ferrooxidans DSM 10331]